MRKCKAATLTVSSACAAVSRSFPKPCLRWKVWRLVQWDMHERLPDTNSKSMSDPVKYTVYRYIYMYSRFSRSHRITYWFCSEGCWESLQVSAKITYLYCRLYTLYIVRNAMNICWHWGPCQSPTSSCHASPHVTNARFCSPLAYIKSTYDE